MAERLSGGNNAIALLANTVAMAAALLALILTFGPISAPTSIPRFPSLTPRKEASAGGKFLVISAPRCAARLLAFGPRTQCSENGCSCFPFMRGAVGHS